MKNLFVLLMLPFQLFSQVNFVSDNIFQADYFIENNGQFDYDSFSDRPILFQSELAFGKWNFHKDGVTIQQLKLTPKVEGGDCSKRDSEFLINKKENIEERFDVIENIVSMQWLGANKNCKIIASQKSNHYFSYGSKKYKSYGYKELTFKNMYPNIDIVYSMVNSTKIYYKIILRKGANISDLRAKYNTDVLYNKDSTSIMLANILFPIYEFNLKSYYKENKEYIISKYLIKDSIISYDLGIDEIKNEIVIDPWVSNTDSLTGDLIVEKIGFDVDFDSSGNLYVYGGGPDGFTSLQKSKLAKYSDVGSLDWVFSCQLPSLNWNDSAGFYISNFIVDKNNSSIYIGEGWSDSGSKIVRLSDAGLYDSFISTPNKLYQECWDLQFNCQTGDIITMGGSTKSNLNLGVVNNSSSALTTKNITGQIRYPQDVASSCIDSKSDLYIIISSQSASPASAYGNKIYKVNKSYTGNIWNVFSGYYVFFEAANKMNRNGVSNGFNALSANSTYLFYYNGKNIKAFSLVNGDSIGNSFNISGQNLLEQGGIESDECNNIYVGGNNGNVKMYHFNDTNFIWIKDYKIAGKSGNSIYDIRKSNYNGNLYVSGKNLVASISIDDCDSNLLDVDVYTNCNDTIIIDVLNSANQADYIIKWVDLSSDSILQKRNKTHNLSDTFIGVRNRAYQVNIARNSICHPAAMVINVTLTTDTTVHKDTIRLCKGEVYRVGNSAYSIPGVYLDTINKETCSEIIETLIVLDTSYEDTVYKYLCFGEFLVLNNTDTVSTAGIYIDSIKNDTSCQTIYIVSTPSDTSPFYILRDTICFNETYFFRNKELTASGTYIDTLMGSRQCDSFIILNLIVLPKPKVVLYDTICNGEKKLFGSKYYDRTGKYIDTLQSTKGCDSFAELNLWVLSINEILIEQTVCHNQFYTFGGNKYYVTGNYVDSLKDLMGCDSIVKLNLIVLGEKKNIINKVICEGDSIRFGGKFYKHSGLYNRVVKTVNNCDSFIALNLVTKAKNNLINYYNICHGDTIKGKPYYNDTIIIDKHLSSYGCDSNVVSNISIKQIPISFSDTVICTEDTFFHNQVAYVDPIIIIDTIKDSIGCGSIISIQLSFIDCDTINECNRILVPSAFTPNDDGVNDRLFPIIKSNKISIDDFIVYDRWGSSVFKYSENEKYWDGYHKGRKCLSGAYTYILYYNCNGNTYNIQKAFTLIR